jgi:phosphatidylinositol glycan class A protein
MYRWPLEHTFLLIQTTNCSRENTVLRGQLFDRSEEDPNILQVRQNLYVIPNTLVADQFKPIEQPPIDTSKA